MNTVKQKIRGAVEFMLFMPGAEKPFRETSFKSMIRSFIIPLMLIPYGIFGMSLTHNTELQELSKLEGINNFSFETFVMITIIKALLITAFMLTVIYFFAKWMERSHFFYDYVSAGNWIIIPGMVPSLILLVMILTGGQDWMGVYMVATLNIIYGIAVSAFMTKRLLEIPWELAGAVAIFGLAVGETANKVVNLIGTNYFA